MSKIEKQEKSTFEHQGVWDRPEPFEALKQVATLTGKATSLEILVSPDALNFCSAEDKDAGGQGILAVAGRLVEEEGIIEMRLLMVRGGDGIRVPSAAFFTHLADLGERTRLLPPSDDRDGASLWVGMNVKAAPMGLTRCEALSSELQRLGKLADLLRAELPPAMTDEKLLKLYKNFADTLEPVRPIQKDAMASGDPFVTWAQDSYGYLEGALSIALASPFAISIEYAQAVLAGIAARRASSMGHLTLSAIHAGGLVELVKKAPGLILVPADRLTLGTNPYELANAIRSLLHSLFNTGRPVAFTGSLELLQSVFSGGQGGSNDPLFPVLRHVPDVALEELARFAVRTSGQAHGGIPERAQNEIASMVLSSLDALAPAEQKRVLPVVARRAVMDWSRGTQRRSHSCFALELASVSETLAGLSSRPRVRRKPQVQARFLEVLRSAELLAYLKEALLGQDRALQQLCDRLLAEILTRPDHQPIRYAAQGTPATGKSESAILLASRLDIPYINIDAASMSDHHTAMSQLLGSGRGIVGSHQAGRLEQVAKHHTGALIEVSDLDHAAPQVRSTLADIFLQVLETGEAQSATGAMFSCANLIFAFTMNLPHGLDETIRKGIGFGGKPTELEIGRRVASEIKSMLSGAFMSRAGTPILFEPLSRDVQATILEEGIRRAVERGAQRLEIPNTGVCMEEKLGETLLGSLRSSADANGARTLLEHGRLLASKALSDLEGKQDTVAGKRLHVRAAWANRVVIEAL